MFEYSINLVWHDNDKGYIATIPEFPGLSAFGETAEEAVKEAQVAAEGFIEVLKEDGEEIPLPQKSKPYSGQIRLRLPVSLHEKLAKQADKEGLSLNSYMLSLLSEQYGMRTYGIRLEQLPTSHVLTGVELLKSPFTQRGFVADKWVTVLKENVIELSKNLPLFSEPEIDQEEYGYDKSYILID